MNFRNKKPHLMSIDNSIVDSLLYTSLNDSNVERVTSLNSQYILPTFTFEKKLHFVLDNLVNTFHLNSGSSVTIDLDFQYHSIYKVNCENDNIAGALKLKEEFSDYFTGIAKRTSEAHFILPYSCDSQEEFKTLLDSPVPCISIDKNGKYTVVSGLEFIFPEEFFSLQAFHPLDRTALFSFKSEKVPVTMWLLPEYISPEGKFSLESIESVKSFLEDLLDIQLTSETVVEAVKSSNGKAFGNKNPLNEYL